MSKIPRSRLYALTPLLVTLLVVAPDSEILAQISIVKEDFYSIVRPGGVNTALVPESSVSTVNLGNQGGPSVYDFRSLAYAAPFVSHNFFVDSIPLLVPRYPVGAVTFGLTADTIQNNPVFVFLHDTLFQAGNVTLGDEFRFRHFSPLPAIMPFPLTYGQSFPRTASYTDSTFDLSWQLITAVQADQPSSCMVDGYGTLKIPGQEAACLRLRIDFPQYNEKSFLYISNGGFLVNIDLSGVTADTGVVPFEGMGVLRAGAPTEVRYADPVARGFALFQNYPNPFNPTTVIRGEWAEDSQIRLVVYDLLGRTVARVADGRYPAGNYSFTFDGSRLSSGMYFYRLTAGRNSATKSMVVIK
jgi:hypothetical protein